jgi:hypothetical protein
VHIRVSVLIVKKSNVSIRKRVKDSWINFRKLGEHTHIRPRSKKKCIIMADYSPSIPAVSDDDEATDDERIVLANSADTTSISSDSSGSIPGSPNAHQDEPPLICRWEGCNQEQPDMSLLVSHLHDSHMNIHFGGRGARYICEWQDCPRKGAALPSRFSLVSHMRSHTGEKPYYCTIPECDRTFSRSDVLAKHMRTVHGVPEDGQKEPIDETSSELEDMNHLKRQLTWATELRDELNGEYEQLKRQRTAEWAEKEKVMDHLLTRELGQIVEVDELCLFDGKLN